MDNQLSIKLQYKVNKYIRNSKTKIKFVFKNRACLFYNLLEIVYISKNSKVIFNGFTEQ